MSVFSMQEQIDEEAPLGPEKIQVPATIASGQKNSLPAPSPSATAPIVRLPAGELTTRGEGRALSTGRPRNGY